VQVSSGTDRKPGVPAVVKWLGDLFEAENILIERGADGQIRHVDSDMVQFYGNIRILFLRKKLLGAQQARNQRYHFD
jgi:hypothetical protein